LTIKNYEVWAINSTMAQTIVIENHYLHRSASCSYAFGLFDGMEILGVLMFGKPASNSLCEGICGPEESSRVLELTRLWIQDGTPKNTESYFIGQAIKLLPIEFDILVSYAEIQAGHVGTIYQATNWLYTGLSDRHVHWEVEGMTGQHSRHLFDNYGGVSKAKEILGDKMIATERPRKHRYIMFRGSKAKAQDFTKETALSLAGLSKGASSGRIRRGQPAMNELPSVTDRVGVGRLNSATPVRQMQ